MRYVASVSAAKSLADLQSVHTRLTQAQNAATSGLKHARASDDPTWYDTQTRTNAALERNAQFEENVATAVGRLERTDGVLDQATNVVTRLQEIAVQMANGTYSAAERTTAAAEVASLKESMLALANEKDQDGYIFGGYRSDTAPYDTSGNFVGDANTRSTQVGQSLTAASSLSPTAAFDFGVFDQIGAALSANDPVAVSGGLPNIASALNQVTHARTMVGDRLNILDRQATRLQAEDDATKSDRTRLVEADPIETYTEIAKQTTALQAALKVSASTLHMSLFDYL